jgi:branched-chain amino acid transport system ATP-binding protein
VSALLETTELSVRFGGLNAVDKLSMSVEAGTIVGIIGPNGAGKSTFVNVVTGFVRPNSGRVLVSGKDVTGVSPWTIAEQGVARTFQIVKPFRDMTVRENIAIGAMFGSEHPSLSDSLARAEEVLNRVGLAGKAEALPGELPIVDNKRLELGKALAMQPRLLLLDEVMAGLRPNEIDRAVDLVRSLRDDGLTIVVIEHVMRAILAVSDRVFVMHEGRELAQGTPEEIAADDRVIEAYLGERYAKRRREANDARDT